MEKLLLVVLLCSVPAAGQEFSAAAASARDIVARAQAFKPSRETRAAGAPAGALASFKICSSDKREDVFLRLRVYPGNTVDARECYFSKPDGACVPISGLARSNRYALADLDARQLRESAVTVARAGAAGAAAGTITGLSYEAGLAVLSISEAGQAVIINLAGAAASAGAVRKLWSLSIRPALQRSSALAVVQKTVSQGREWDCNLYDGSVAELDRSLHDALKDVSRVAEEGR